MKRPTGPAPRAAAPTPAPKSAERRAARVTRAERKAQKAEAKQIEANLKAAQQKAAQETLRAKIATPVISSAAATRPAGTPAAPVRGAQRPAGANKLTPAERAAEKKVKRSERLTPAQREAAEAKARLREAQKARKAFEKDEVRRFTAHLRRRRQTWAAIWGSLAALALFVCIGVFTPIMALQDIQVQGATRVDAAKITAALTSEVGKPLPLVNMGLIQQEMESQPLVKSYSVESLPPHTLLIKVVERAPAGFVANADGTFTLVDPAGVTIETTPTKPTTVPQITIPDNDVNNPGFRAGIDVLQSLPSALAGQVTQVIAKTTDNVVIVLKGGARVFWGGPENAAFKSNVLAKLLTINPVGSVSEYDVSSPKTAVVR